MQNRNFKRRSDDNEYVREHVPPGTLADADSEAKLEDTSIFRQQATKSGPKEVDCGEVFWTWALRRS